MHNLQAKVLEDGVGVFADDAGIAAHANLIRGLGDRAFHDNHLGLVTGDS